MSRELSKEEIQERLQHKQALEDIRAMFTTRFGKSFLKYLIDTLDVNILPDMGLQDSILHDRLGFLRAGNSIFKIISEADPVQAGLLLAQVEKERYEKLYAPFNEPSN